jgi:hypothetical protein
MKSNTKVGREYVSGKTMCQISLQQTGKSRLSVKIKNINELEAEKRDIDKIDNQNFKYSSSNGIKLDDNLDDNRYETESQSGDKAFIHGNFSRLRLSSLSFF